MITKFEKRVIAMSLAFLLVLSSVGINKASAYATETIKPEENVGEIYVGNVEITSEGAETSHTSTETTNEMMPLTGETAVSGDYTYAVLENGTVEVTGYTGQEKNITIPSVIDEKTVVSVGEEAFKESTIESVTIPKTVTALQYKSFAVAKDLKTVTFEAGSQLKTIDSQVFWNSGITEITVPEGTESIGEAAFCACGALKKVILPDSVKEIGDALFAGSGVEDVTLGNGITELSVQMFWGCRNLKTVVIPTSVTKIASSAFQSSGLEVIQIPASVVTIEDSAFYETKLKEVYIPDSVTSLGRWAFCSCKELNSVVIGNQLAYIDERAFAYSPIKDLTIGTNVKTIGKYSFEGNEAIEALIIPNNVTSIEYRAFSGNTNLADISFPDSLERLDGYAFDKTAWYENQEDGLVYANNYVYQYKGTMPENTEITLAKGTRGIADTAFYKYANLKSIQIPEGVVTIGILSFFDCIGLTSIDIPNSVTNIGQGAVGYKAVSDGGIDLSVNNGHQDTHYIARGKTVEGFKIYGYTGSAAETYAKENGIEFVAKVKPETVTLDQTSLTMNLGDKVQLNAAILPEAAANKTIKWTSSDENVAYVDETGVVVGLGTGTVTITAASEVDNSIKATCEVTVNGENLEVAADVEDAIKDDLTSEEIRVSIGKDVVLKDSNGNLVLFSNVKIQLTSIADTEAILEAIKNNEKFNKISNDNLLLVDISLISIDNLKVEPNGQITIHIPYPVGSGMDYDFSILHMNDGNPEDVSYTKDETGINMTVNSLSPFAIGWTPSAETGDANPETGDATPYAMYMLLMLASLAVLVAFEKKKNFNR